MRKKILLEVGIVCAVLFLMGIVLIFNWKSLPHKVSYVYFGKQLSLGDYSFTNDKDEFIFVGRLNSMYYTPDGMIYATVTYSKTGKTRLFLIPTHIQNRDEVFVLYEPKTYMLTNIEITEPMLFPDVSGILPLQGQTLAFYIATTQNPKAVPLDQRPAYHEYFGLLGKHFSCNQKFIQEVVGFPQTSTCPPFVQTIVAKS